jgi:hypothetical protein
MKESSGGMNDLSRRVINLIPAKRNLPEMMEDLENARFKPVSAAGSPTPADPCSPSGILPEMPGPFGRAIDNTIQNCRLTPHEAARK